MVSPNTKHVKIQNGQMHGLKVRYTTIKSSVIWNMESQIYGDLGPKVPFSSFASSGLGTRLKSTAVASGLAGPVLVEPIRMFAFKTAHVQMINNMAMTMITCVLIINQSAVHEVLCECNSAGASENNARV